MNIHTHSHRHFQLPLEREARLCLAFGQNSEIPHGIEFGDAITSPTKLPGWLAEKVTHLTAEVGAILGKAIIYIPVGFLNGLETAWQNNKESGEKLKQDIINASSFFRHFPLIGKYFEGMQFKDVESYRNLTDNVQWIEAFNDLKVFQNPAVEINNKSVVTPRDLLMSLRPEERKAIYMNFVDSIIPAHVLGQNGLPVAGSFPSASERFGAMAPEQQVILNSALKGIFDATDLKKMDPKAQLITKQTLNALYRPELALHDLPLKSLQDDYVDALAGSRFAGLRSMRVSATQLENSPYAPANLRAAMKLGIVNDAHLQSLSRGIENTQFRESSVQGNVRKNLEELTGIVETDRRRDALGVREIFENMNGAEKVILLCGALLALSTKIGRGVAGAGALLYFGMKFGFKDPDPLKTASGWINNILTLNGRVPNDAMPGGPADPRRRVDGMMAFLKEYDPQGYNRLEMQATGFSLMGDMRMSDITANMNFVSNPTNQSMRMSVNALGLRTGLEKIRKDNKWKASIDRFFMDPASMQELTNGFGYVFYKLASQNPANFEYAKQLNDAMRKLPAALSIADLPCVADQFSNPTMRDAALEANSLYMKLVMLGQNAASSDRRQFGDVVASLTRVPQNSPRQSLQENGVAYAKNQELESKEGPGADDREPAGATDKDPTGADDKDPKGSTDVPPPGADERDPKGATDKNPTGADDRDPKGPADKDPRGADDREPAGADDRTPKGATDTASGSSDVPPAGPRDDASGADDRTPKGPSDATTGANIDSPRGPSDDMKRGPNDSDAPGAETDPKSGSDSRAPEGSSTPETNETEKTERIKKISEFLVSLDSKKNLIGQDLNIDLGKSKVLVKFTKNRILVQDTKFKLEAEIDLLFDKTFKEAEFNNVHVAQAESGEVGLHFDAAVLKQSDAGVIGASELEEMLTRLASGNSFEGKTSSGRKTRITRVDK